MLKRLKFIAENPGYLKNYVNDTKRGTRAARYINEKIINRRERSVSRRYVDAAIEKSVNSIDLCAALGGTGAFTQRCDLSQDLMDYFSSKFDAIDWANDPSINRRKPWMLYYPLENCDELTSTVTHYAEMVAPYLDAMPMLQSAYFWKSIPIESTKKTGSQLWHMDRNDTKQVRVFLALDRVTEMNGALSYYERGYSDQIYRKFDLLEGKKNLQNRKRLDEMLIDGRGDLIKTVLMDKFEVSFIDTSNVYHRGSIVKEGSRHLLVLQFTSPWSLHSPLFGRGQHKDMNPLTFFLANKISN